MDMVSKYHKRIKKLNELVKKEPLQFQDGFSAESIRELDRERVKKLIELANRHDANKTSNHNKNKNFVNLLKKVNIKNIHKETDTGEPVGNEEW
jgi:uncharacterized protein (UPF0210 family)